MTTTEGATMTTAKRIEDHTGIVLTIGDRVYHEASDRYGVVEKINIKRRRVIVRFAGEKYGAELFGVDLDIANY